MWFQLSSFWGELFFLSFHSPQTCTLSSSWVIERVNGKPVASPEQLISGPTLLFFLFQMRRRHQQYQQPHVVEMRTMLTSKQHIKAAQWFLWVSQWVSRKRTFSSVFETCSFVQLKFPILIFPLELEMITWLTESSYRFCSQVNCQDVDWILVLQLSREITVSSRRNKSCYILVLLEVYCI